MTGTPLPPPQTEKLVAALKETVQTLVSYRTRKPKPKISSPLEAVHANDFMETDEAILEARDIAQDPVGHFLREGIHQIGQLIYDQVGMKELESIADRIINAERSRQQLTAGIIDKAFDGIGSGNDRWWA